MAFFDEASIKKHAAVLEKKVVAAKSDESFETAWRTYHDTFANNGEAVVATLYDSFLKNVKFISPTNLNGTTSLLKELGEGERASKLLAHYLEARKDEPEIFDLEENPFAENITDEDVVAAFRDRMKAIPPQRNFSDSLRKVAFERTWGKSELASLAETSVDEYYDLLKKTEGRDLGRLVRACLQFETVGGATPEMKAIAEKAKEALARIGKESKVNARRVRQFGVKPPS